MDDIDLVDLDSLDADALRRLARAQGELLRAVIVENRKFSEALETGVRIWGGQVNGHVALFHDAARQIARRKAN
jgi:hypothetical protein